MMTDFGPPPSGTGSLRSLGPDILRGVPGSQVRQPVGANGGSGPSYIGVYISAVHDEPDGILRSVADSERYRRHAARTPDAMTVGRMARVGAKLPDRSTAESQPYDQGGFVLVFFALALITLLGIASLVVDYGYWSLRSQQIQRAADAAALAGVAYMPNVPKAISIATTTAADNGFTNGVVVTPTDASGNTQTDQLTVKITDARVPTFFAKVFDRDTVAETRTSTAKLRPTHPSREPGELTGDGQPSRAALAPGATSESQANDWLAISGYCTASGRTATVSSSPFTTGTTAVGALFCPNDGTWAAVTVFTNVDYNPNGYVYDINDPPGINSTLTAAPVTVEIYDSSYNAPTGPCGNTTGGGSNAGDNSDMPCGVTASVTTNWLLYGPGTGGLRSDRRPGRRSHRRIAVESRCVRQRATRPARTPGVPLRDFRPAYRPRTIT